MSRLPEARSTSAPQLLPAAVAAAVLPQDSPPRENSPTRFQVCLIALGLALFIVVEPMLLDASRGLQFFQSVLLVWFWGLFMFRGPAKSPADRH